MHIDDVDRKILYYLDLNSKQSTGELSQKLDIPKSTLNYRIKKLIKEGVILNYYAHIDTFKLGYHCYRLYISYQYTTPKIENDIINYLLKNKLACFIASPGEKYNLGVVSFIRDLNEYQRFYEDLINKYGYYFSDIVLSAFIKENTYSREYLLDEYTISTNRVRYSIGVSSNVIKLSDLNYNILEILSSNAQLSYVDIAHKLKSTPKRINFQVNKMIKLGIILGFRININISKIGYRVFKVDIFMNDFRQRQNMINYLKTNPHLWAIYFSTGYSQLEIGLHLRDIYHLTQVMKDMKKKFPDAIRSYEYFNFDKFHKFSYFP